MKSDSIIVTLIVALVLIIGFAGIANYDIESSTGSYVARSPAAVPIPLQRTGQADYIPPYHTCYDTDGGKNFYVKGELFIDGSSWVDKCENERQLGENFCMYHVQNQPQRGFVIYDCPRGCLAGKCNS